MQFLKKFRKNQRRLKQQSRVLKHILRPRLFCEHTNHPSRSLKDWQPDKQFEKFAEHLKKLNITIPLTDALTQIPVYSKFFKDILSNKRGIEEVKTCQALGSDPDSDIEDTSEL